MKKMSRESADLLVVVILGGIIVYATIQGFRQLTVLGIAVYMLYFLVQIVADVILISPFKRGGYDALKEVSIPLIPHLGYKEMTPLGQAEWMN